MDTIDHIYYINLDTRTDRRAHIEKWLTETGVPQEKVTRFSAVAVPSQGHRGCCLSHIQLLEIIEKSEHNRCLILEDDFVPLDKSSFWNTFYLLHQTNIEYDVVLCAFNKLESADTEFPFLKRAFYGQTTSGYLITRNFAKTLRTFWEGTYAKLVAEETATNRRSHTFMLDIAWSSLMKTSRFFAFFPRLGKQIESYSDLENRVVNYNV